MRLIYLNKSGCYLGATDVIFNIFLQLLLTSQETEKPPKKEHISGVFI